MVLADKHKKVLARSFNHNPQLGQGGMKQCPFT